MSSSNNNNKVYLVTGANSGLGLDATRQLALRTDVAKVYLACRSKPKAEKAMADLASAGASTDKLAFLEFDGLASKSDICAAVDAGLEASVALDGVVLNAGGIGDTKNGGQPAAPNNILPIVQINVAAHVHLVEYLLERGNLVNNKSRIVFSGSEGARGINLVGMKSPQFSESTPEYFTKYLDGSIYSKSFDAMNVAYPETKGYGALYFAAWARKHPGIFVLTISPGGTKGTAFASQGAAPSIMGYIFPILMTIFTWFGFFHALEVGAKRYVDAVTGKGEFTQYSTSGSFIASKSDAPSGPVADQVAVFANGKQYGDVQKQDAAYEALNKFL